MKNKGNKTFIVSMRTIHIEIVHKHTRTHIFTSIISSRDVIDVHGHPIY